MHIFIRQSFIHGLLLCLLFTVISPTACWGVTYYVNDSGTSSDMNSGTQEAPLRTVQEALNRVQPGDEVVLETGTYREELQLVQSGTSDQPIIVKAEIPGEAFLLGSDVVEGWELSHDQIWFKPNWEVNSQQVFVDGERLQQIGPNCVYHDLSVQDGTALPVVGSDISDMFAGSFWYDTEFGQLYVWLPDGSSPNDHFMEASVRPFIIAPNTIDYISLDGLVFAHSNAGATTEGTSMVNIGGNNWTVQDTHFMLADIGGLSISGTQHTLTENTFLLNGSTGLSVLGLDQETETTSDPQDIFLSINETTANNSRQFHYSLNPGGLTVTGQGNSIVIDRHLTWRNEMFGIAIDSDCQDISIDQSFFAENIVSAYCIGSKNIHLQNSIFSKNIYGIGLDNLNSSHFQFNTIHANSYGMLISSPLEGEGGNTDLHVHNNIFNNNTMLDLGIYDQQFINDTNTIDYNAYARDTQEMYALWVDFLGFPRLTTELSVFQEQTGMEGQAVISSALWEEEEASFIPGETTAVVDRGQFANLSVPVDFYGLDRPWGSEPDIGAVEYRPDMDTASYPHELETTEVSLPEQPPEPQTWILDLSVQGQGNISANPDLSEYENGTTVELTAVPDSGWEFTQWSGDLSGSENPADLVMDAHKSVNSVFAETDAGQSYIFDPNTLSTGYNPVGDILLQRKDSSNDFGTQTGIASMSTPIGDQALRLTNDVYANWGEGADRWLVWTDVPTDQEEIEFLYLFRRSDANDTELLGCMRMSAEGDLRAYAAGLRNNQDEIRGRRLLSATDISNAGAVSHNLPVDTVNDWIWVRGRMDSGSHTLKARTWLYGDPEPSDWTLQWADPDQSISLGGAGLEVYLRTSDNIIDLAWWSVGASGTPAPMPEPSDSEQEDYPTEVYGNYFDPSWAEAEPGLIRELGYSSPDTWPVIDGNTERIVIMDQEDVAIRDITTAITWGSNRDKYETTFIHIRNCEEVVLENLHLLQADTGYQGTHTIFVEDCGRVFLRDSSMHGLVFNYHVRMEGNREVIIDNVEIAGHDYGDGILKTGGGIFIENGDESLGGIGVESIRSPNPRDLEWLQITNCYIHDSHSNPHDFNHDGLLVHSGTDSLIYNNLFQDWVARDSAFDVSHRRWQDESYVDKTMHIEKNRFVNNQYMKCPGRSVSSNTILFFSNEFAQTTLALYHHGYQVTYQENVFDQSYSPTFLALWGVTGEILFADCSFVFTDLHSLIREGSAGTSDDHTHIQCKNNTYYIDQIDLWLNGHDVTIDTWDEWINYGLDTGSVLMNVSEYEGN